MNETLIPLGAAALSLLPTFYGFACKSALQCGATCPPFTITLFKEGFKAAPTIGAIVGSQIILQEWVEKFLPKSPMTPFTSALLVGCGSSPLLAAFNGQTMGMGVVESIKNIKLSQVGLISARELGFLFTLKISDPVGKAMQNQLGESEAVEVAGNFFTGFCNIFVHPADTLITLSQKKLKVTSCKDLWRGGLTRSVTLGAFIATYRYVKRRLSEFKETDTIRVPDQIDGG